MAKQNYDDEWALLALIDRFERIKRHRDYQKFCDDYPDLFNEDGWEKDFTLKPVYVKEGKYPNPVKYNTLRNELQAIKDKFGLATLIHYSKDAADINFLDLPIFTAHSPVKCTHHRYEEDGVLISIPVHPDNTIHLQIDVSPEYPVEYILDEIKKYVKSAREAAEFRKVINRYKENEAAYRAYDLFCRGTSHRTIASHLNLKSPNTAWSKVKRGHVLIYNEPLMRASLSDNILASEERWDEISDGPGLKEKLLNSSDLPEKTLEAPTSSTPVCSSELEDAINKAKSFCIACGKDRECKNSMIQSLDDGDAEKLTPCKTLVDHLNSIREDIHTSPNN